MKKLLVALTCFYFSTALGVAQTKLQEISEAQPGNGKPAKVSATNPPKRATVPTASGCKSRRNKGNQSDPTESLIKRARREGAVGVIVGLCLEFTPEGKLANSTAVQKQRRAIARAQDKLLNKLSRYKVSAITKYKFEPFIAMHVDAAALKFLKGSSDVSSIEEDVPVPSN